MTASILDEDRAEAIINAYGGDPARWPDAERAAVESLLMQSPRLQQLRAQAVSLDDCLEGHVVAPRLDTGSVLAAVDALGSQRERPQPKSAAVERWLDWLLPASPALFWRTGLVAALPLTIGIWLGSATATDTGDWSASEQYVFAPMALEVSDG